MSEVVNELLATVAMYPTDSKDDGSGLPFVTHQGTLRIGSLQLTVCQLNDGQRVIPQEDFARFLDALEGAK